MFFEERNNAIIQHLCSGQSILAVVELSACCRGVSIDECLLIDSSCSFDRADIKCFLSTEIDRMFFLNLSVGFLFFSFAPNALSWFSVKIRFS
jgi:hypothetical protein